MKNEADIFIYTTKIDFNLSYVDFRNSLDLLNDEEKSQILSKKSSESRCQALSSTFFIKEAIKNAFCLSGNCFQIKRDRRNRPYIKNNKKINIDFNISHSKEWMVCGVSIGKIGIDIEEILPIDINIAKEFLSKEEWGYLSTFKGEKVGLFYKYWTLKESYLKAVGIGINDFMKEINFGILDNEDTIFKKEINKEIWYFYHAIFQQNYALSLTAKKPIESIKFKNYQNIF